MNRGLPGSSVRGVLQARVLEWVAMASSRGSSPMNDISALMKERSWTLLPIEDAAI